MPIPDLGPRLSALERLRLAREMTFARRLVGRTGPGGKRPDDGTGEAVPVKPDRPLDLSGGAAAALEVED